MSPLVFTSYVNGLEESHLKRHCFDGFRQYMSMKHSNISVSDLSFDRSQIVIQLESCFLASSSSHVFPSFSHSKCSRKNDLGICFLSAGVTLMGLEHVGFLWYMRRISPWAALGFAAGIGSYALQRMLVPQ